jgi:hypothetical protein
LLNFLKATYVFYYLINRLNIKNQILNNIKNSYKEDAFLHRAKCKSKCIAMLVVYTKAAARAAGLGLPGVAVEGDRPTWERLTSATS